jgi:hypothetical protein
LKQQVFHLIRSALLGSAHNVFAGTLRETLDDWDVLQAEVSRTTGIPSPHLTDMKKTTLGLTVP